MSLAQPEPEWEPPDNYQQLKLKGRIKIMNYKSCNWNVHFYKNKIPYDNPVQEKKIQ
jgi:hypothetical protein